MFRLD
ncbi:hypothetical protein VCHENC02_1010A, partial [Vibrio harveyi]